MIDTEPWKRWLKDDGKLFVHIFCHRRLMYPFETEGDEVKGRSLEMQTFGREPSVGLSAELKGVASGDIISLVKKYDGSGGQSHSVHLRLSYDADGNLTGEWMLDPQTKGRVELFKLGFTEAELDAFAEDDYD